MGKVSMINVGEQPKVCEIKDSFEEKCRIAEGDYLECVTLDDTLEKHSVC